jgi:hypothetical protein
VPSLPLTVLRLRTYELPVTLQIPYVSSRTRQSLRGECPEGTGAPRTNRQIISANQRTAKGQASM